MADASRSQRDGSPTSTRSDWSLPLRIRLVLPAALIVVALLRYVRPLGDPDTFWHIVAGDWLRETWQFRGPDPFSDQATNEWVVHGWLADLGFSYVHEGFGIESMSLLMLVGLIALIGTLWFVCRQRAPIVISLFVVGASIAGMSSSISPRPQVISFIFIVLFTHAWLRSSQDGRARWWLLPASWFWASLHGLWVVGPILGAVVLVGGRLDGSLSSSRVKRLLPVLAGTGLAPLLTPLGLANAIPQFQAGPYAALVSEWRPVSLLDPNVAVFMFLAGLVLVIAARGTQPLPWTHLLLVAVAVAFAMLYLRTVAVGAAVLAPVAATSLHEAMRRKRESMSLTEVLSVTAGAAVGLALSAAMLATLPRPVEWGPTGLHSELAGLPNGTRVCNEYSVGGWLLYSHPQLRPTVDGRAFPYPAEHVARSMSFANGFEPVDYVHDMSCRYALLPGRSPAVALLQGAGWVTAGNADGYALLTQPGRAQSGQEGDR